MKALYLDGSVLGIALYQVAAKVLRRPATSAFSPVKVADIPEPSIPNERWLKVRNIACGLCGSDLHFMDFQMDTGCFPAATPGIERKYLGHEVFGEVIEVGREVHSVEVGDRVALRVDWPSCAQMELDPPCRPCSEGQYSCCENLGRRTLPMRDVGAGFSPVMVVHDSQPFKLLDGMTNDQAILLEPTASATHGVYARKPGPGDRVLVVGCGTMGLLTIAVVKAIEPKAEVVAIGAYDHQMTMARVLGADRVLGRGRGLYRKVSELTGAAYHRGPFGNEILLGGFDVVYDTVGSDHTISDALRFTRSRGTVVLVGLNFKPNKIDYTTIWHQEITLKGINSHGNDTAKENSFEIASRLMVEGKLDPSPLITHRLPVEQWREAVRLFEEKSRSKALKIVLEHH